MFGCWWVLALVMVLGHGIILLLLLLWLLLFIVVPWKMPADFEARFDFGGGWRHFFFLLSSEWGNKILVDFEF